MIRNPSTFFAAAIPAATLAVPAPPALASQLYAAYARATQARLLASVVGEEGLSESDRRYLALGTAFERQLIHQAGARTLDQSMEAGWRLLRDLPHSELARLSDAQIEAHLGKDAFLGV